MTECEQKQLDFFALETLTRCMLSALLLSLPNIERDLVRAFEGSVDQFALSGVDPDSVPEFRDYMKQRGLQWIASASPRRHK